MCTPRVRNKQNARHLSVFPVGSAVPIVAEFFPFGDAELAVYFIVDTLASQAKTSIPCALRRHLEEVRIGRARFREIRQAVRYSAYAHRLFRTASKANAARPA